MVGGSGIVSATIRGPPGCSAAREGPAEVAEVVDTKFAGSRLFLRRAEWKSVDVRTLRPQRRIPTPLSHHFGFMALETGGVRKRGGGSTCGDEGITT